MARYRPLTEEIASPTTVGSATTVSEATVVRAVNTSSSSPYVLTLVGESGSVMGSMTIVGQEVVFIDKPKSWKLYAANSAVKFTSVSYPV